MPVFVLHNTVSGLFAPDPITIADESAEARVALRLTDPLLAQRSGDSINVRATFETATAHQTLILTQLAAADVPLIDGQLVLRSLQVRVRFGPGSGQVQPLLNAPDAVAASGEVEWRGLPPALGLAGDKLRFALTYDRGSGAGRFVARLAQPLDLPALMCRLDSAELAAEALPAESAFLIALSGGATLHAGALNMARPLLDPLFGAGIVAELSRPKLAYRQKIRLAQPAGLPRIDIGFDWSGAPPALTSVPAEVGVTIGLPHFMFVLPDFNTPPPAFDVRFTECHLRFPGIAGMQPFDLTGAFDLRSDPATGNRALHFTPTLPGGVDLPALLRLFLSRLEWVGSSLDDLAAQARFSVDEAEWLDLFRGLLPAVGPLDLPLFTTALRGLLEAAASTTSYPPERIFYLAFEGLNVDAWRAQVFPVLWSQWVAVASRSGPDAIAALVRALGGLSPAALQDALVALVRVPSVDLSGLLLNLFGNGVGLSGEQYARFLRLLAQLFAAMITALDPAPAARALMDAWTAAPASLRTHEKLGGELAHLDLSISIITRMICDLLTVVVLIVDSASGLLKSLLPNISLPRTNRFLHHLFSPITDFFEALDRGLFPPWTKVAPMLKAMAAYASGDRSREVLLLEASRYPVAGVCVTIGALFLALERPTPWTSLLDVNIEERPDLAVKRLPAPFEHPDDPSKSIRYLVLSDIHRDAAADNRGLFEFGSIHHYSKNSQLYLDILNRADEQHYTVIENGDCEELWFIRDFDQFRGFPQMVSDILQKHQAVYAKLRDMHRRGRYFRVYGNHDSYLREAEVVEPLRAFMESGHAERFVIYDFIVIDGVKRMNDTALDILTSWPDAASGRNTTEQFATATLQHFAERLVGFDSRPYREHKQLIITHGHQWDFWNCDEHNLVGKMLANMVGVTVDKLMDPFTDVEGVAYAGNPSLDFQQLAAVLYPADNWLSETPALAFAHRIQHMPDTMRVLNDSISYSETLVAVVALFTLPLDRFEPRLDASGRPVTNSNGQPQFNRVRVRDTTDPFARAMKHYGHSICVGHTHAPHSMPSFDIATYLVGPILGDLINFLRGQIPFANTIRFKSSYLNSGTSGWMHGVVWGVELHETGQPRLMFWTSGGGREPQRMDWELYPWPADKRQRFDALLRQVFPSVREYLDQLGMKFGAAAEELGSLVQQSLGLPPEAMALFAAPSAAANPPVEMSAVSDGAPLADLQGLLLRVFAFLMRLAHDAGSAATGPQVFTVSVDLPPDIEALIGQVRAELTGNLDPVEELRQAAGMVFALANLERVTRGMRQFPGFSLDQPAALDSVWMVVLLMLLLPQSGRLTTNVAIAAGKLTLTITARR